MDKIVVKGARTHNLKNVDITIPRDKLVVITGLSGSGKSSLAFDTLYAEGQRRYVESLSAYARQFLSMMEKPDVDHIDGLSPAISIEQKSTSHNPRSTVGTITEIYDYLRLLYARVGEPCCPEHDIVLKAQTISQMVDTVMTCKKDTKIMILAPIVRDRKGEYVQLLSKLRHQGFIRARIDGDIYELDEPPKLALRKKHTIEVVVDRLKVKPDISARLAESFETALRLAEGLAGVAFMEGDQDDLLFSANYACPECGYSMPELSPRMFSFNNPNGACENCEGLGMMQFLDPERVVHDPTLSLSAGAIRGWDRRNAYYFNVLKALAEHYDFSMEKPFNKLSKKVRDILLYGSGDERIEFQYKGENNRMINRKHRFEGVISNMERRYQDTESSAVREELAKYLTISQCSECEGTRLCLAARHVFIEDYSLPDISSLSIIESYNLMRSFKIKGKRGEIANKILKEIIARLGFLNNVGLDYLTIERSADTLSGGEAQRIRLASQIGAGLVGVLYILDEPSIGLHQRDNDRLLKTLFDLRDLGNTVLVVEHDEDAIRSADYLVDMGPGAGVHGGDVVAEGSLAQIKRTPDSITGQFLSGKREIVIPKKRKCFDPDLILQLSGATANNLNDLTVEIPVGLFTCITGVSGSGKSSLINDTLYPIAARELNNAVLIEPGPYESCEGLEHFDKVIDINQSPIGRTPRSNPATYTGLFTAIRELFAGTPESRGRGYQPGRFSFNVKGGRCEACQGDGMIRVEMHFLADVYVECDVCKGKRYNRETLEVHYKGKSIAEVLAMTVFEALEFFTHIPSVSRKLQTLVDVGLSYIKLGQSATTLSGGEAQRIKLARELSKRDTGRTMYLLDEPTTGLHFHDIEQLLKVLLRLRERGNTIIVIEHNLDVIKTADWIIDLGPEGGDGGGKIIAVGTPEQVTKKARSHTGRYLKKVLAMNRGERMQAASE